MLGTSPMRYVLFSLGVLSVSGVAAAQQAPCDPPCVAGQMCTTSGKCVPVVLAPPPPGPAPPAPPPPSEEEREKRGERLHDGFYFRFALGAGFFSGSLNTEPQTKITGPQLAVDLAFGGTPVPGLVIGGGIYGSGGPVTWDASGITNKVDGATFSTIGPFVDWYPNPRDGWHLTGMLGLSRFVFPRGTQFNTQNTVSDTSDVGGALMIGGGYEFWIGRQWSLGLLGRLQVAAASVDNLGNGGTSRITAFEPALLGNVTYH